jgi:choline kinase
MMNAIILAAGRGMRLNSGDRAANPKCMEDINGISIMHYQLKNCLKNGIKKFVIVVGYQKEILMRHVCEILNPDDVTFIENERFAETNTLYSLWLTKTHMREDFVYFNADVLFHPDLLAKLFIDAEESLLLVEKKAVGEEEVKVLIEDSTITEIHKQINPKEAAGEFIGVGKFAASNADVFIRCLETGVMQEQHNNYFEWAVNLMCKECRLIPVYTDGLPCIEIDFPEDLRKAKEMFANIKEYI